MQDPRCRPGELEKQGKTPYALMHNIGLGGSCVVGIFKRPDFYQQGKRPDGRDRVGYNHGCECKAVTIEECVTLPPRRQCSLIDSAAVFRSVDKVKSRRAFSKWAEANL